MIDDKPRRRIVMLAKIEADSWDDLRCHLHSLSTELAVDGRLSKRSISGGYSTGHIIVADEDDRIDHDSWAAGLNVYLEDLRLKEEAEQQSADDCQSAAMP